MEAMLSYDLLKVIAVYHFTFLIRKLLQQDIASTDTFSSCRLPGTRPAQHRLRMQSF
jgi:hypothetical protein